MTQPQKSYRIATSTANPLPPLSLYNVDAKPKITNKQTDNYAVLWSTKVRDSLGAQSLDLAF